MSTNIAAKHVKPLEHPSGPATPLGAKQAYLRTVKLSTGLSGPIKGLGDGVRPAHPGHTLGTGSAQGRPMADYPIESGL